MGKKHFTSTWLSNVSVALIAVGGFQHEMSTPMRITAIFLATMAYVIARILAKEDD